MHITSFLYDEPDRIRAFIAAASTVNGEFFQHVMPIYRPGDNRIRAVAFFSKDADGCSDEAWMGEVAESLAGILEYDVEIVSAWEKPSGSPQRVWPVRGRQSRAGAVIPGEVVRRELES